MMNGARNCLLLPKRMIYEQTGKEVDLITSESKNSDTLDLMRGAQYHNVSYRDNTTQKINDAVSNDKAYTK